MQSKSLNQTFCLPTEIRPLGIYYTLETKTDKEKYESSNKKHLEIFDLSKENRFNLTGEFIVEVKDGKQNYKIVAIHPNRTIHWITVYSSKDHKTLHSSKIELADDVWLGYKFEVFNHSTVQSESQELIFTVLYPLKEILFKGLYNQKDDSFDTDLAVEWMKTENDDDQEKKHIAASFQWRDLGKTEKENDHQTVILVLKHPSFEKDVFLKGSYYKDVRLIKLNIDYEYCNDGDHAASFSSELKNWSDDVGYKNYTIKMSGLHEASELKLQYDSSVGIKPNNYKIEANGFYKRGYLPEMELELLTFVDTDNNEIKFYRTTPNKVIDVYTKALVMFPVYKIDGIYDETTGVLMLDLAGKIIDGNVNFTSDGLQNLQIRGKIPDTRSARFNIWRNYEDVQIKDISYFIQMNHSRLVSSKLVWRPKMRTEIKELVKSFMMTRYVEIADEMDYWLKTFYTETIDILKGIWDESKPYTQEFIDDLSSIKDFDQDLSSFRSFLNESFYADDFYMQSLITYSYQILDELAITDHFQTIPKIFKEMMDVLGESSLALKNSITLIIDTIKASYKESIEMFNQLMQGNSLLEHLTKFMEIVIEKYDRFVKDLHVSFIAYVETLYDNLVQTIATYSNRVLQSIEPQIIRSIHYIESILWNISTEIFDFMYNRTNELIESPYFTKVSNITHDLDVLYQDLQNNDMFSNLRKYGSVMWQFLKEKFLRMVPFGKEMKEIVADITNEFKELQKIEGVKEALERYQETKLTLIWVMKEFQLEKRLNNLVDLVRNKFTKITLSALQTEDVYREAKTKFVFDPEEGFIEWQQKIPVAWHAFNETPHFEEIPEYKIFNDVQKFLFSKKNDTIWSLYYGLKPFSEPHNLLPPFDTHSLLIGSHHVVTFDGLFVNLLNSKDESCSHLLAHDFVENDFTFFLETKVRDQQHSVVKILVVKTNVSVVELELGNPSGSLKTGQNGTSILPTLIGDIMITRELNVVTISSHRGFLIECNLEFDVCNFQLSGWYFGKVAGVMGTINNENFDDLTKSDNALSNEADFIASWGLEKTCIDEFQQNVSILNDSKNLKTCELFFKQKTSYFATCYLVIDPNPFFKICVDLHYSSKTLEKRTKAACTAGLSYIEACSLKNVPLRIPDSCIKCNLPNGSFVTEGEFVTFTEKNLTLDADVVFITELCNINAPKKKFFSNLISSVATEFKLSSIADPRFAVIPFGGSKVFKKPRAITINGHVFTKDDKVKLSFEHLKEENNAGDVFSALATACKLVFKPGAVKIFVLSLCSKCSLKFDFKSVTQLLRENDVTLHILTEELFNIKKVIGVDRNKAFLRKDQNKLVGDEDLKRQIILTKSSEKCAALAFETDGSMFSYKLSSRKDESDVFAAVFAKRITHKLKQKKCHVCECEGTNSGSAFLSCTSCNQDLNSEYDENFDTDEDSYEDK